jgi:hypothetical protein
MFIVAYNLYRVHFPPHNEHIVFLLQISNSLILFREIIGNYGDMILFREIIGNYGDSHVKHDNTLCGHN